MAARFDSGSFESYGAVEAAGTDVTVPDAYLMFTGDYSRSGSDLILNGSDGAKFVITEYFQTDAPPALLSPEGAMLTGQVVTALAGPQYPGQYAQAGGGPQGAEAIGKVQTLTGGATVVRANGVTETLEIGEAVFQGDVVMTGPGGKLGIGFVDGTVFSLSANARMVLNSLVYDPDGSNNSMLFSLVEGTFVFASGKIAPTGDMKINTPVATMGIRGTAPTVEIVSGATQGGVVFSIVPDPDGHVGTYTLYSLTTGLPIGTINQSDFKWQLTSADGTVTQFEKTEDDLLNDQNAINDITTVFNSSNSGNQQQQQGDPNDITNSIPNNQPPSSGLNTGPGNTGTEGETPPGNAPPPPEGDPPPNGNPPTGPATNNDPPPGTDGGGTPVTTGPNEIFGTPGDDIPLDGTEGDDRIDGLAGDDTINALGGDDVITIGPGGGADTVNGGAGDDRLIVSEDSGWVFDGGDGFDIIEIKGGLDADTRTLQSQAVNYEIIDLNTTDANALTITAEDIADANDLSTVIVLGNDEDTLNASNAFEGKDGAWQLENAGIGLNLYPGVLFDQYVFEDGTGTLATAYVQQGITVNQVPVINEEIADQSVRPGAPFSLGIAASAFFADLDDGDALAYSATFADGTDLPNWLTINSEGELTGTPPEAGVLDIRITATDTHGATVSQDFTLRVGNIGRDGTDIKFGSNGEDVIAGLNGADFIFGRGGDDQLFGDGGTDLISGGRGNDIIHGGGNSDFLSGGRGDDQIFGDDGNDLISGGRGNDTIHGGAGNDILSGDRGDDTIYGDEGNDTLFGGRDDDILAGGPGDDDLYGGSGGDSFVFTSLYEGVDTIKDFDLQQDVLDLSGLLSVVFDPGGAEPLSDYVRTEVDNGDTKVSVDLDGQGFEHSAIDIAVLQGIDTGTINVVVNDEDPPGAIVV